MFNINPQLPLNSILINTWWVKEHALSVIQMKSSIIRIKAWLRNGIDLNMFMVFSDSGTMTWSFPNIPIWTIVQMGMQLFISWESDQEWWNYVNMLQKLVNPNTNVEKRNKFYLLMKFLVLINIMDRNHNCFFKFALFHYTQKCTSWFMP